MDRISSLEDEILQLRRTLQVKEKELQELKKKWIPVSDFLYFLLVLLRSHELGEGRGMLSLRLAMKSENSFQILSIL